MIRDSIDSVLEELASLAPVLSAEVEQAATAPLSAQARACKEALMTTRVLMDKLNLVRRFSRPSGSGICTTCEGD